MTHASSTKKPSPELSVVIPAYCEERRLPATLERVTSFLLRTRRSYEVLVVDDGSSDGTVAVAERHASHGVIVLRQPENRGKGAAVKRGVLASSGRVVLVTDADLSTPIEDLARLEAQLANAEVVLGSRALAASEILERQPLLRELMGRTFNLILRGLGMTRFRDTQCGFKLLEGHAGRRIAAELAVERFAFDVEMILLAEAMGYRVCEVPVTWSNSPTSHVHPLRDSLRMLVDVVKLRLSARRRRPGGL